MFPKAQIIEMKTEMATYFRTRADLSCSGERSIKIMSQQTHVFKVIESAKKKAWRKPLVVMRMKVKLDLLWSLGVRKKLIARRSARLLEHTYFEKKKFQNIPESTNEIHMNSCIGCACSSLFL